MSKRHADDALAVRKARNGGDQSARKRGRPAAASEAAAGTPTHTRADTRTGAASRPAARRVGIADADERALEAAVFGGAFVASREHERSPAGTHELLDDSTSAHAHAHTHAHVWRDEDEDDEVDGRREKSGVDLARVSRLRKLRQHPDEDVVSHAQLESRLRAEHARRRPNASNWAALPAEKGNPARTRSGSDSADESEEEEQDADLFASAGALTEKRTGALPPGEIATCRVRDLNRADACRAVVQAVTFHPSGSVCAVAGLDKRLRFFTPDGKRNACVASVHFADMPIASASWCGAGGREIVVTGRRPFFYVYDVEAGSAQKIPRILGRDERSLESLVALPQWLLPGTDSIGLAEDGGAGSILGFLGNDGNIILTSARTKTWVANLKMNGTVRAATFARPAPIAGSAVMPSGGGMPDILSVGSEGEVYRWDLRMMRCALRHADEGSTGGTALAASPSGREYAVGSTSGIVNVYDAAHTAASVSTRASSSAEGFAALALGRAGEVELADRLAGAGGSSHVPRGLFAVSSAVGAVAAQETPRPRHTLTHLTTAVSMLSYNHDASLLLTASQRTQDAMRLIHAETGKAFGNWPTAKTPLHYVSAAEFSPASGFLAIGNDRGRVLLYRLTHFTAA